MSQIIRIPLTEINPGARLRNEYGDIPGLMASLEKYGQMQAIGINQDRQIIYGGRRYFAHVALNELYPDDPRWSSIDATVKPTPTEADLREMELEENFQRLDMTWQEHACGVLDIHLLKSQQAAINGQKWTNEMTGICIGVVRQRVEQILPVARAMRADKDSPLWSAPTFEAAARLLMDIKLANAKKLLASNVASSGLILTPMAPTAGNGATTIKLTGDILSGLVPSANLTTAAQVGQVTQQVPDSKLSDITAGASPVHNKQVLDINLHENILLGPCLTHMRAMPAGSRQHIITDPPYAIDMDMLQQENTGMDVSATVNEHQVDENVALLTAFIPEAFRVLADKGFLVMACDAMTFKWLHDLGVAAGFSVCRWPWVWCKVQGMNQAAGYNATKATEFAIVMRKKGAVLQKHQPRNWKEIPVTADDKRFTHPFAKPFGFWEWFVEACTSIGDEIYDPFAGTHSGPCAFIKMGRRFMSSERAQQHVYEGMTHVGKMYTDYFKSNPDIQVNIHFTPPQTTTPNDNVPDQHSPEVSA